MRTRNEVVNDEPGYMIQILEATTIPVTSNNMGQLSGGYIFLRGWLGPLHSLHPGRVSVQFDEIPEPSTAPPKLFCLPILQFENPTKEFPNIQGLVLKPGGKRMHYQRVGYFASYHSQLPMVNYPLVSKTPIDDKAFN